MSEVLAALAPQAFVGAVVVVTDKYPENIITQFDEPNDFDYTGCLGIITDVDDEDSPPWFVVNGFADDSEYIKGVCAFWWPPTQFEILEWPQKGAAK